MLKYPVYFRIQDIGKWQRFIFFFLLNNKIFWGRYALLDTHQVLILLFLQDVTKKWSKFAESRCQFHGCQLIMTWMGTTHVFCLPVNLIINGFLIIAWFIIFRFLNHLFSYQRMNSFWIKPFRIKLK